MRLLPVIARGDSADEPVGGVPKVWGENRSIYYVGSDRRQVDRHPLEMLGA